MGKKKKSVCSPCKGTGAIAQKSLFDTTPSRTVTLVVVQVAHRVNLVRVEGIGERSVM